MPSFVKLMYKAHKIRFCIVPRKEDIAEELQASLKQYYNIHGKLVQTGVTSLLTAGKKTMAVRLQTSWVVQLKLIKTQFNLGTCWDLDLLIGNQPPQLC